MNLCTSRFRRLDFKNKVNADHVCKRWGQLLKAVGARHWAVVDYNVDTIVLGQAFTPTTEQVPIVEHFKATIGRCDTVRTAQNVKEQLCPANATCHFSSAMALHGRCPHLSKLLVLQVAYQESSGY